MLRLKAFQSTLPVRGATRAGPGPAPGQAISIHAPRAGSDFIFRIISPSLSDFNPRSPCGERLGVQPSNTTIQNFNPRSPCGERRGSPYHQAHHK